MIIRMHLNLILKYKQSANYFPKNNSLKTLPIRTSIAPEKTTKNKIHCI